MTHSTFGAFKTHNTDSNTHCVKRTLFEHAERTLYSNRDIALIAAFAAIYIVWGFVSSLAFQSLTQSVDLFFLLAVLFAILAVVVQKPWSATVLGTIVGIVFLGTPAPNVIHITVSLIANGLVFDGYLGIVRHRYDSTSTIHVVIAATLGNLVMAVVGFTAFQAIGTSSPLPIWTFFVLTTTLAGTVGAAFGLTVARRVRGPASEPATQRTRKLAILADAKPLN